jgi:hypothetical protein
MPNVAFDVNEHKVEVVDVKPSSCASKRPQGTKVVKKHKQIQHMSTCIAKVQIQATLHMVATTLKKVTIMEDQSVMVFFTMLEASSMLE